MAVAETTVPAPVSARRWAIRGAIAAAVLLIAVVAFHLRFTNLTTNPAWYTDEGTQLDIAVHMLDGEWQYLAVDDSMLLFSRPPLFQLLLAAAIKLTNADPLLVLRTITASSGLIVIALLGGIATRASGVRAGLVTAALAAVMPTMVLYQRFGFDYHLLAIELLVILIGLWRWFQTGRPHWLTLASVSMGCALVTDISAFGLLPPFVLIILLRRWRALPLALIISIVPAALVLLVQLIYAPAALMTDLAFIFGRLRANATLTEQLAMIGQNVRMVILSDGWWLAGLVGLVALRPSQLRTPALLMCLIPLLSQARTAQLYSLSLYYLIPFMAFIPLGLGALIEFGAERIRPMFGPLAAGLTAMLCLALLVNEPLRFQLQAVHTGFPTAIDPVLVHPQHAREVAEFINARIQPDEVVIASPPVGWMIHANAADFQMMIAYGGVGTPHLPVDLPRDRWVFDPSLANARFVVTDPPWFNWGVLHVPGLDDALEEIQTWPVVFTRGDLTVYEHP